MISAQSTGNGIGNVQIIARDDIFLRQSSQISVKATETGVKAGDLYLNTLGDIELFGGSKLTAKASGSGGDILIGYNSPQVAPAVAIQAGGPQRGVPANLVIP